MKSLTINAGSSSVKVALFKKEKLIVKLHYDFSLKKIRVYRKSETRKKTSINTIDSAIKDAISYLLKHKDIENLNEISFVVHRVVHGGEFFDKAVLIDEKTLQKIEALSLLAPLHNPNNLKGILLTQKLFKQNYAVFDTAYHQTIPEEAYRYGISEELYKKYKIRKYGFHGINHKYLASEAKRLYGAKKVITCHLGNGSSITANLNGKSLDTSMGFTPTDGLIMGTRSGAIDPEVVVYLFRLMHSSRKVDELLNHDSGLLSIGHSSDIRVLWKNAQRKKDDKKKKDAILALEMLSYRLKKYISSYIGVLGGVDAIVFSGGIGENAWYIRELALSGLETLGIKLDIKKNQNNKSFGKGKTKLLIIPANEELQMIKEIKN